MPSPLYFQERAALYRKLAMNTESEFEEGAMSGLAEIFEQLAAACTMHAGSVESQQSPETGIQISVPCRRSRPWQKFRLSMARHAIP